MIVDNGGGVFYFFEMLLGGWLRLRQGQEGVSEMTKKDPFKKYPINLLSSLSMLDANLHPQKRFLV